MESPQRTYALDLQPGWPLGIRIQWLLGSRLRQSLQLCSDVVTSARRAFVSYQRFTQLQFCACQFGISTCLSWWTITLDEPDQVGNV